RKTRAARACLRRRVPSRSSRGLRKQNVLSNATIEVMMRTEVDGQVLANLLFGSYRHRVLSLLMLRPGDRFHVRMISRLTGVPAGSLHRELRLLAAAGLLVA